MKTSLYYSDKFKLRSKSIHKHFCCVSDLQTAIAHGLSLFLHLQEEGSTYPSRLELKTMDTVENRVITIKSKCIKSKFIKDLEVHWLVLSVNIDNISVNLSI